MVMMSLQNMNGAGSVLRVDMPIRKDEYFRTRRTLEPGEVYKSDVTWPVKLMTRSHSERNLPIMGRPMRRLPIRPFTTNFPHKWIDYEDMDVALGPDTPPRPLGWQRPLSRKTEQDRALEAASPSPWSPEERMVYDISGFGNLTSAMSGMGQWGMLSRQPKTEAEEAAEKVATEAATAAAEKVKKEQPSAWTVIGGKVIDFASSVASFWLQKKQLDAMRSMQKKDLEMQRLKLQQQAQFMNMPKTVTRDLAPKKEWYESPFVLLGGLAAAGGVGYLVFKATKR